MKTNKNYIEALIGKIKCTVLILSFAIPMTFTSCINDNPIEYNSFSISGIVTPVKGTGSTANIGKKVYIGHSLPVNMNITAEYDDDDVPVQLYLLNVDDIKSIEAGNSYIENMRFYYCHQTDETKIAHVSAGTHSYGLVINIPAEQSEDEYTGDYKIGTYYVLAEINKYDDAETDAYKVYQKFRGHIDTNNTIVIGSDYMRKPDLSAESMNFTGTEDNPQDSVTFYELNLSKLPGAQTANLGNIYLKPSESTRKFTGSLNVKSSSSDALNVPVKFYLESTEATPSVSIPLEIYDKSMDGYVTEYYIPILRKNTMESISLQLRIPNDSAGTDYFSKMSSSSWDENDWINETNKDNYPLFHLRYQMSKMTAASTTTVKKGNRSYTQNSYSFRIRAEVNPDGRISETRFIQPNNDNSTYVDDNFIALGDNAAVTKANNSKTESITLSTAAIDVKANEGVTFYPCTAIDADGSGTIDSSDCDLDHGERRIAICWNGFGINLGTKELGASANIYAGLMFSNYSLISWGLNASAYITDLIPSQKIIDIETGWKVDFTAESHPFDAGKSYYEFNVMIADHIIPPSIEWGDDNDWWSGNFKRIVFKDYNSGFGEYEIKTPITFEAPSVALDTEILGIGVNVKLAPPAICFMPRTKIYLVEDGSLKYEIGTSVKYNASIGASIGAFDLVTAGITGSIDVVTFDLGIQFLTKTYYNEANFKGKVKGTLGVGASIWATGPQGSVSGYATLLGAKLEVPMLSFQAFKGPIYDSAFVESEKTNWVNVEDANKIDYSFDGLNSSDDAF